MEYVKGIRVRLPDRRRSPVPGAPTATLAGIPQYLRQDVVTTRLSAGIDYQLSRRWSTYFRYVLYDYNDSADQAQIATSTQPVTGLPLSGTSNMFLGGMTAMF